MPETIREMWNHLSNVRGGDLAATIAELGTEARIRIPAVFEVGFRVRKAIVPGEPIPIEWWLGTMRASLSSLGQRVTARVWQSGNLLFTSTPLPVASVTTAQSLDFAVPSGLEAALYTLGRKTLTLELTGDDPQGTVVRAAAPLDVVPETVDASWWEWSVAPFEVVKWKEPFYVSGALQNRSAWATLDASVRLIEENVSDQGGGVRQALDASGVGPRGGKAPLVFAPIKQDWEWLIKGIWIPKGPLFKTYRYRVEMFVKDRFGNSYTATSSTIERGVEVVAKKRFAASNAAGLTASAAAAAAACLWPLAGGFYAAASVAGYVALDPPEPNDRYGTQVTPVLPPELETPGVDALGRFVRATAWIYTCALALYETHGRLLGARRDVNEEGVRLQTAAYDAIEALLRAERDQMLTATESAQRELDGLLATTDVETRTRRFSQAIAGKIPRDVAGAAAPQELVDALLAAARDPRHIELLHAVGAFTQPGGGGSALIRLASEAARRFADETLEDRATVFDG